MKRKLENILVTGRAGFIGSNFIHFIFSKTKFKGRIIMEKLQYIKRSREIRVGRRDAIANCFYHLC